MLDASLYLNKMLTERYHIVREIGHGASSVVFYAEDMMTKQEDGTPMPVALKILDKDSSEYKLNSRSFKTETRAVVDMPTNPHTVAVQDVSYDCETDVHFIVMEYVKGSTLRRYMNSRGSFSAKEIVSISLQVLQALRNAHCAGVVHRDVKPQNILVQNLAQAGNVSVPGGKDMPYIKLADFGIARLPDEDLFAIADHGVGTVHYISPEQAGGRYIDERSDLYSLGVVMYEMATGRVPFDAENARAIITRHQTDAPTHVRMFNPSIPLSLDRVIFTAMQKDPRERFKDASAMERKLYEVLKELDGTARKGVEVTSVPNKEVVVASATKAVKMPKETGMPKAAKEPKAPEMKLPKNLKSLLQSEEKPKEPKAPVEMPKEEKVLPVEQPKPPKEPKAPAAPKAPKVPKAPKAPKATKERRPLPKGVFIGSGAAIGAILLGAIALLLVIGLVVGGIFLFPRLGDAFGGSAEVTVPNLEGTLYNENSVYAEGITVIVSGYENSDTVKEGYIISQSEGAGKVVKGEIVILVVVSAGPTMEDFTLPSDHVTNYAAAKAYLEATYPQLRVNARYEKVSYDPSLGAEGAVIGMKYLVDGRDIPLSGGQVPAGRTEVVLVINGDKTISLRLPSDQCGTIYNARVYIEETYGDLITVSQERQANPQGGGESGTVWGVRVNGQVVSLDREIPLVANETVEIVLLFN